MIDFMLHAQFPSNKKKKKKKKGGSVHVGLHERRRFRYMSAVNRSSRCLSILINVHKCLLSFPSLKLTRN